MNPRREPHTARLAHPGHNYTIYALRGGGNCDTVLKRRSAEARKSSPHSSLAASFFLARNDLIRQHRRIAARSLRKDVAADVRWHKRRRGVRRGEYECKLRAACGTMAWRMVMKTTSGPA